MVLEAGGGGGGGVLLDMTLMAANCCTNNCWNAMKSAWEIGPVAITVTSIDVVTMEVVGSVDPGSTSSEPGISNTRLLWWM